MLRRTCLKQLGLISCASAVRPAFPQSAPEGLTVPSLCAAAAKRNVLYGATPEIDNIRPLQDYQALLARHCALIAPNLSWASISKTPGVYDFKRFQPVLDFAQAEKKRLTGAHLLWHLRTPEFFSSVDKPQARQMIVDHVTYMCKRFAGQVWSWNVVNEALNPREGRPDGLRKSPLLTQLDTEFFDIAFHTAREADPKAVLVYNDYDTEYDSPDSEARRKALLALLDSFLKRKLPIDAIGLQTHIKLERFKFDPKIYRQFLSDVAARGVRIVITELDVLDNPAPSDIVERDRIVADAYKRILDPALDEKAVSAVVTWGLSDKYTWLNPGYDKRFGRTDGLPGRPLPFDADFRPKPAYRTILECFEKDLRR